MRDWPSSKVSNASGLVGGRRLLNLFLRGKLPTVHSSSRMLKLTLFSTSQHHTSDNIQIKSRAQQVLRKQKNGVAIFDDLKAFRHEQSIPVHPTCHGFLRHGLPIGQPMFVPGPHQRPASDVLQAACGLALLEEKPLVFPRNSHGMDSIHPTNILKSFNGNH